jgi:hypothetical protein
MGNRIPHRNVMMIGLAIFLVCCVVQAAERVEGEFPLMRQNDLPGLRVVTTGTYEGQGLYGYIDGGAELYLEYGFQKLVVQDVVVKSGHVTVEVYRMKSPLAAFGVFSISRYRCTPVDSIGEWSCQARHQLQFVLGEYYIRVVNATGSAEAQAQSMRIAFVLKRRAVTETAGIPGVFDHPPLRAHRQALKYMAGKLGLQNGFPEWSDRFDGFEGFRLFVLPVSVSNGEITLAMIRFADARDADLFRGRIKTAGSCSIKTMSPSQIVCAESSLPPSILKPYLDAFADTIRH